MSPGLVKKWDHHPDWLGHYEFATAKPLRRKWYSSNPVRTVKTSYIEYEARERRRWDGKGERLFFKTFIWRNPPMPPDVPEEVRPTSPRHRLSACGSAYSSNGTQGSREHVTTREELVAAFNILVTMEEQLHYALLDITGAFETCVNLLEAKFKGSFSMSPWSTSETSSEYRTNPRFYNIRAELQLELSGVQTAAHYFSAFLAFLDDHERSRRFPNCWDEYDHGPSPWYTDLPAIPPDFPFIWAFQLTHVLSGCFELNGSWVSMWHYRPLCDDPCEKISQVLHRTYAYIEGILTQTGVPTKKWGKWHVAYRKPSTKRRASKKWIKSLRAESNPFDHKAPGQSLHNTQFLRLLMDCYYHCLSTRQGSWYDRCCANQRGMYDSADSENRDENDTPPTAALNPELGQPAFWQGTIENRNNRGNMPGMPGTYVDDNLHTFFASSNPSRASSPPESRFHTVTQANTNLDPPTDESSEKSLAHIIEHCLNRTRD